jgi:acyl-CoA synthetase (AMP-forming)/AMP-acid ligase II
MASLIACFKAGIIAIPVFPPDPRRLQKDLHHFISIQKSSGATIALTHGSYNFAKKVSDIQGIFSTKGVTWPNLVWIVVDDVLARGKAKASGSGAAPAPALPRAPSSEDVAFLQYTSGSTSEPKGVMITHGNLAHNLTLIIRELKANQSTVNVSWLPQYHDMGLIGKCNRFTCCLLHNRLKSTEENAMILTYITPKSYLCPTELLFQLNYVL